MGDVGASIANEEFWSSVGYWILVAGLVGDIVVLTVPRHRERLEKVLAAFFTIVIIIGVAIEHRADATVSVLVSQQQMATGLQMAQLTQTAGDARTLAETERLARLKLEAQVQPRTITIRQQEAIVKACRPFSGHSLELESYILDPEGFRLAQQIKSALEASGIRVEDATLRLESSGGFISGVAVWGAPSERRFIETLLTSLKNDGLLKISTPYLPVDPKNQPGKVILFVGLKPFTTLNKPPAYVLKMPSQ